MKLVNKLGVAAASLIVGFGALQGEANASGLVSNSGETTQTGNSIEMIQNGDFDNTDITGEYLTGNWRDGYYYVDYAWNSLNPSETLIERGQHHHLNDEEFIWDSDFAQHSYLKQQGYNGLDSKGSDGKDTGNFFAGHSSTSHISQTFTLGDNIDPIALFSFDLAEHTPQYEKEWRRVWNRRRNRWEWKSDEYRVDSNVTVSLFDSQSNIIWQEIFYANDTSWTEYEFDFEVDAGEQYTVDFEGSGAITIDDVSFLVNKKTIKAAKAKVPEPTSILGLAAISGLAASSLKRKRKSSNIELS